MTRIVRKYWRWDPQKSIAGIRVGDSIDELKELGLVQKVEDDVSDYSGAKGFPWSIREERGIVDSVFCRQEFFDLIPGIWDKEVKEFSKIMSEDYEEIESNEKGCRLRAVFRGGFIAIAGIENKN